MDSERDGKSPHTSDHESGEAGSGSLSRQASHEAGETAGDAPAEPAGSGAGLAHASTLISSPDTLAADGHAPTVSASERLSGEETLPADSGTDTAPAEGVNRTVPHLQRGSRYAVQREVGRGGMGRVMLAHDAHIDRDVALKEMFRPESSGALAASEIRFLREARLSARLGHPSIVPVFDLGELPDGTLYYTMRFVEGGVFDKTLNACGTLEERLRFLPNFRDICNAVAYAHSRKIIHRDLKPANIIVGEFGETMVVDWGLAKFLDEEDPVDATALQPQTKSGALETKVGSVMGTPAYMSPEQAAGEIHRVDERSDQYSLGAILYELLTGRPPFAATADQSLIVQVVSAPLVPVLEREPAAPRELAVIAERALSKRPADRFASTKEVADEIGAYLSGEKLASYDYSVQELLLRFVRRHKAAFAAGAFVLVALIATLIVTSLAWRQASEARNKEALAKHKAQRSQAQELRQRQLTEGALAELEEKQRFAHYNLARALVEKAEQSLKEKLPLDALVYATAARLHNPTHPRSPWHHPDFARTNPSASLVLARANGAVLMAEAATAMVFQREIHPASTRSRFFGGVWRSQDDRIAVSNARALVATHAEATDVRIYDVFTGRLRHTLRGHQKKVRRSAFAARGDALLTVDDAGEARLWHAGSGALLSSLKLPYRGRTRSRLLPIPRSSRFLWADTQGDLWVVTPETKHLRHLPHSNRAELLGLCLHPDGELLVAIGGDGVARSIQLRSGETRTLLATERRALNRCAFSANGRRLFITKTRRNEVGVYALSKTGGTLRLLWEQKGLDLPTTVTPSSGAESYWIGPDNYSFSLFATQGARGLMQRLSPGLERVALMAAGPRGTLLFMEKGGGITSWEARPATRRVFPAVAGRIQVMAGSPDGTAYVLACWDHQLRIYDKRTGRWLPLGKAFKRIPWAADWSPDGRYIVAGSGGEPVRVYDAHRRKLLHELRVVSTKTPTLVFSADSAALYIHTSRYLYSYAMPSGKLRYKAKSYGRTNINGGATAPSRRRVLVYNRTDQYVTDFATGKSVRVDLLKRARNQIHQCAAIRGDLLVCQDASYDIHIWRYPSLIKVTVLRGNASDFASIRAHPSGKSVLASMDDGTVNLWELSTGRRLLRITETNSQFAQLSPDGKRLFFSRKRRLESIPLPLARLDTEPHQLLEWAQQKAGLCIEGILLKPLSRCKRSQ